MSGAEESAQRQLDIELTVYIIPVCVCVGGGGGRNFVPTCKRAGTSCECPTERTNDFVVSGPADNLYHKTVTGIRVQIIEYSISRVGRSIRSSRSTVTCLSCSAHNIEAIS